MKRKRLPRLRENRKEIQPWVQKPRHITKYESNFLARHYGKYATKLTHTLIQKRRYRKAADPDSQPQQYDGYSRDSDDRTTHDGKCSMTTYARLQRT